MKLTLAMHAMLCHTAPMPEETHIEIYTDGACSPNPGPGGYGVVLMQRGRQTELCGGFHNTTNNRMEIFAAIAGLRTTTGTDIDPITVYSDSRYLVDMFNGGYAVKWRANGWRLASRKKALNTDLWAELLELTAARRVRFEWVRGHNEHPQNERCDALAVDARQQDNLPPDVGYDVVAAQPVTTQLDLFSAC